MKLTSGCCISSSIFAIFLTKIQSTEIENQRKGYWSNSTPETSQYENHSGNLLNEFRFEARVAKMSKNVEIQINDEY